MDTLKTPYRGIDGNIIGVIGICRDITERKRIQEALEKRMIALTRPLDHPEGVTFEDLFSLEKIQTLQDQFASATGVASIITDTDGTPITQPSNFCRLCSDIIRKTDKGRANCFKSDAKLGRRNPDGPTIQPCLSGGFWDAGAGISVGGRHIANWLIGQVRDKAQTDTQMRAYANEIGADEEAFIEAFHEVPAMSRGKFEKIARVLFTLANQLSDGAYRNVQQARFISEKEHAESALQESKIFLENISDIAYTADNLGNVTWVNAAIEQVAVLPMEEIIGKPFLPLFMEADHASLIDVYQRTLQGESLENTLTFKSGFTCHFTSLPKRNKHGDIIGTFGVARDITERLKMEQALKDSEQMYRTTFDAIPDSITVTRQEDGRYKYVNDGFYNITGYSHAEVIGKTPFEINLYANQSDREKMVKTLRQNGELLNFEIPFRKKDGSILDSYFSARPVVIDGDDCLIALTKDVTELKRAEGEKARLENQLRQAQKMESVGRLAGGVAHDFNNMLGVILGHTELALLQADENHDLYSDLKEIQKAAKRSADITKQLLAFARKDIISPKKLDLNDTVESMLNMLRRLIGEDIDLVWKPSAHLWSVKMDPSQIDQILANLCVNARDAIPGVGKLTIETGKKSFDEEYCKEHAGLIPGDFVLLAVSDNGSGMDKEKEHSGVIDLLMTDVVMPEMNGRDLVEKIISLYPEIRLLFMSGYTADIITNQGVLNDGMAFIQKPFSLADMTEKVRELLDMSSDKNQG